MPILTRRDNLRFLQEINDVIEELARYDNFEDSELFWKLFTVAEEVYDNVRIISDKKKENERLAKEKEDKSDANPQL